MNIELLFKIAAVGILVAVLHQVLGLVIVLTMVIKQISGLFDAVRTMFNL